MEFRPLRRSSLSLCEDGILKILNESDYGVLSLLGDGGYPYGVPVNYVFDGKAVYVHSAAEGHKSDALAKNRLVSFTVVARHRVIPEKFATSYSSVIVFGETEFVTDKRAKAEALRALVRKYSPETAEDKVAAEIDSFIDKTAVIKIVPHRISGKRGAEN